MNRSRLVARGFTLMELLVVLLIIGILSTVALRTMDTVRDRSLFDQTAAEMEQIVKAITGDPSLISEGRRTDFGFYGDMGKLPDSLPELVRNTSGSPHWHGPYLRRRVGGDSISYLYDGWGNRYGYDPATGTLNSLGNGKYPMTVRAADSLPLLTRNSVSGNISDVDGLPPGDRANTMLVRLYPSSGATPLYTTVDGGGFYALVDSVRVGTHRMVVMFGTSDSLVRWVTVAPRSNLVVDFRFGRPFRNQLVMIGPAIAPDSFHFLIQLANEGATDDTISWMRIVDITGGYSPDSVFLRRLEIISGALPAVIDTAFPLAGIHDTMYITPWYPIAANRQQLVTMNFAEFWRDEMATTGKAWVNGRKFVLRFSDGSEITVDVPEVPGI